MPVAGLPRHIDEHLPPDHGLDEAKRHVLLAGTGEGPFGETLFVRTRGGIRAFTRKSLFDRFAALGLADPFVVRMGQDGPQTVAVVHASDGRSLRFAGMQSTLDDLAKLASVPTAPAPPLEEGPRDPWEGLVADVQAALTRSKTEAVRLYRERTEIGLADAKAAVDAIARGRPVPVPRIRPPSRVDPAALPPRPLTRPPSPKPLPGAARTVLAVLGALLWIVLVFYVESLCR